MSNNEHTPESGAYLQPLNIHHLLEIQASRRAEAIAICGAANPPISFRRLLQLVENTAKTLNDMGIGKNDRVAIVSPNGPEMACAFLAVSSAASFAPINPQCRTSEFDFYFTDLAVKALILRSSADSAARAVAQKHSIPIIELSPMQENDAGIFSAQSQQSIAQGDFAQAKDVALILYTSGTTARPKMVPLTHSNLLASASNIAGALQLTDKDRCLNVMPLFHIHGLVGAVLSSIMVGSEVVCASGFDAEQFLPLLAKFRPTWYTAVPTIHQAILKQTTATRRGALTSSLRLIRSASAPLPSKVAAGLEEVFKVPVIESYGMTEVQFRRGSSPVNYIARYLVLRFHLQKPFNQYARNALASSPVALWHEC